MAKFDDSLRGYAYKIHHRDGFQCRYCGLDCSTWPLWLWLSVDHLLPKGHPRREEPSFKVTACMFCNTADNRYLEKSDRNGTNWDSLDPAMLVERRRRLGLSPASGPRLQPERKRTLVAAPVSGS